MRPHTVCVFANTLTNPKQHQQYVVVQNQNCWSLIKRRARSTGSSMLWRGFQAFHLCNWHRYHDYDTYTSVTCRRVNTYYVCTCNVYNICSPPSKIYLVKIPLIILRSVDLGGGDHIYIYYICIYISLHK